MQQLRSYQAKSKKLVESAWSGGARAPILILPTGSGKTTIVAHLVREFPSRRVLFLCPWRELVYQAHRRFVEHGIPAGISMGCLSPKSDAPVHISTIQTASRRNLGRYDLVVIDEAHRAVSKSCLKIVKQYPRSKILGITATGRRHDGKPLSKAFDRMLIGATVAELTRSGHFAPYECYASQSFVANEGLSSKGTRKNLPETQVDRRCGSGLDRICPKPTHLHLLRNAPTRRRCG